MILITLSTFLSVIVINLYFRGDKKSKVPRWLKRVSARSINFGELCFSVAIVYIKSDVLYIT